MRNKMKFGGKELHLPSLIEAIKMRLGHWVKFYSPKFPYYPIMVANIIEAICTWLRKKKKR